MSRQGKIFIVDDNKDLLVALKILLGQHFETIETESNPNLIPGWLRKINFDVILLDMNFTAGNN
nr:sigma-54-dependent Fis family transcriptional regulator [Bacteroidota bacterium]